MHLQLLLAQRPQPQPMPQDLDLGPLYAFATCFGVFGLILGLLMIVSLWKLFTKAGKPGWAAIIPIYNTIVFLEIAGKPVWWFLLLLIPFVNIVVAIIATIGFANAYGKGGGFAVGLIFLPMIFFPILAFGSSRYLGRRALDNDF